MTLSHFFSNSSLDSGMLFSQIFPDSNIAKKFAFSATKAAYLICFGLAPYFRE